MKERARHINRKVDIEAEKLYREMEEKGKVIIDRLPRKRINLNEYKRLGCIVLSHWN